MGAEHQTCSLRYVLYCQIQCTAIYWLPCCCASFNHDVFYLLLFFHLLCAGTYLLEMLPFLLCCGLTWNRTVLFCHGRGDWGFRGCRRKKPQFDIWQEGAGEHIIFLEERGALGSLGSTQTLSSVLQEEIQSPVWRGGSWGIWRCSGHSVYILFIKVQH